MPIEGIVQMSSLLKLYNSLWILGDLLHLHIQIDNTLALRWPFKMWICLGVTRNLEYNTEYIVHISSWFPAREFIHNFDRD